MSATGLAFASVAVFLALYVIVVLALLAFGRRGEARSLAGFIPDCIVLFRRLLADERMPRSRKLALLFTLGYLGLPVDLIPDFIPVAGQLDDAIVVALVLRFVLRGDGPALVDELWPGPPAGVGLIKRVAFGAQRNASLASRMP